MIQSYGDQVSPLAQYCPGFHHNFNSYYDITLVFNTHIDIYRVVSLTLLNQNLNINNTVSLRSRTWINSFRVESHSITVGPGFVWQYVKYLCVNGSGNTWP